MTILNIWSMFCKEFKEFHFLKLFHTKQIQQVFPTGMLSRHLIFDRFSIVRNSFAVRIFVYVFFILSFFCPFGKKARNEEKKQTNNHNNNKKSLLAFEILSDNNGDWISHLFKLEIYLPIQLIDSCGKFVTLNFHTQVKYFEFRRKMNPVRMWILESAIEINYKTCCVRGHCGRVLSQWEISSKQNLPPSLTPLVQFHTDRKIQTNNKIPI